MNGFDHCLPDAHVAAVADALARRTGLPIVRGVLEDAVASRPADVPTVRGELLGARLANLLPGVWSARMPLKLGNRRCEAMLEGWAEPWAAFGAALGLPDERPALDAAWRLVVQSQAHDSIGGCGLDAVADATAARHASAEGLATETTTRVLERLAGQTLDRRTPWSRELEIVVFNPSPHVRTDVVRVPLDPYPALRLSLGHPEFSPLVQAALEGEGWTLDGRPVRVVASDDPTRTRWLPGQPALDVELVAADVPAFGCRRLQLVPAARVPDLEDDGRDIA
jgi:hypothetical protein